MYLYNSKTRDMKIFSSQQIRLIDKFTIENEPIASIDLMERAANELFFAIMADFNIASTKFLIIAGPGNNGGDGLALARIFTYLPCDFKTIFCNFSQNISTDCNINVQRLQEKDSKNLQIVTDPAKIIIDDDRVIIDCIFGTGLTRPVTGKYAQVIDMINNSGNVVISVDIPSGLFGEDNTGNDGSIINASCTYTIQFPPLASMFAENYKYFGNLKIVDIMLSEKAIVETESDFHITEEKFWSNNQKKRGRFEHKGDFGHALLIVGSYGKAGAAVLAAKACMRSGVGLLTVHVPEKLTDIMQISIPEAMLSIDSNTIEFSSIVDFEKFNVAGIGPGLGTNEPTKKAVIQFVTEFNKPLLIDADALNILAETNNFKSILKPGTILTPHPKEFERLFGKFENSYHRILFMQKFSVETGVIIVLKGGITAISLPDGNIYFNTRGNPGMATGGSGDVLSGIITGLLAQNYKPEKAAIVGVFIHSAAGDYAAKIKGENSLIASDIIDDLPKIFLTLV